MRLMRCPDCKTLISWVPTESGRRVPVAAEQTPEGDWYIDADGVLTAWRETIASDVPRYTVHIPCPEGPE